ncbi:RING zinc finger protein-like protein [Saccharata proteae CBS 121410]|uniref:E3 ubiquitin-protein ligase listerin n=1 Tax=Saccharata proteae CBS 121410 TaxID=1314787 RepID=A0A9P4HQ60_9PEZI|nr:RING zinc finger protein-like protein [Saccharata proteae CBS 121410]
MSKRTAKSQASSSRAAATGFGGGFGFGSSTSTFGASASPLSYVSEPPNLSSISDANTVVAFKNLSKKDSTTKAKALEDLQAYVSSAGAQIEDALLEAWTQLYPRTSIDSSRRVRQLAHAVHGQIAAASGKRIAKHMPKVVGAWLSGTFDNDKGVARSAQEAFAQVFSTPEKLRTVRKAYQQQLLEYCRDVIDKESATTLSDERSVSADDAEAKYNRVISSSVAVMASLLVELSQEDLEKEQSSYDELMQDTRLWDFAHYSDPAVRRAIHRLLRISISKQEAALAANLSTISKSYLATTLNSDQTGSAYEFSETLFAITSTHPTIWTEHYSSKKPATQRLRQFLKRGSQGGPREYWDNVVKIINALPKDMLPATLADASDLLTAVHGGIISKDEPRMNYGPAFTAYFKIVGTVSGALTEEDQRKILVELVSPIIFQHVKPSQEGTQWNVPAPQTLSLIQKALEIPLFPSVLGDEWPRLTEMLVEDMKTSLPQQSKDFEKSQIDVTNEGQRWATVGLALVSSGIPDSTREQMRSTCRDVLREALDQLRSRNGKPYGSAAVVEAMLHNFKTFLFEDAECTSLLTSFITQDLSSIFLSPSCSKLAFILYAFDGRPGFQEAWDATMRTCLAVRDEDARLSALGQLLSSKNFPQDSTLAVSNSDLQSFILNRFQLALDGSTDWDFLSQLLRRSSSVMSSGTADELLSGLTQSLSIAEKAPHALQGLSNMLQQNPELLKEYVPTSEGSDLLRKIVYLTESADDHVASEATSLESRIQSTLSDGSSKTVLKSTMFDVIRKGLTEASSESVSPSTLVELAQGLLRNSEMSTSELVQNLLPSQEAWEKALASFLDIPPPPSFAITSPLQGAVHLVERQKTGPLDVSRDSEGWSAALRMAWYTSRILKTTAVTESLSAEQMALVYRQLTLVTQLADDNVSRAGANDLFIQYSPGTENDVLEFISETQSLLHDWLGDNGDHKAPSAHVESPHLKLFNLALQDFNDGMTDLTPSAFHNARAFSRITSEGIEMHGWHGWQSLPKPEWEGTFSGLKSANQSMLANVAYLVGYSTPLLTTKEASRFCNELVAQITGFDINKDPREALYLLVLLNTLIHNQEELGTTIAKQRLIFLVKHIMAWLDLDAETVGANMRAETYRALMVLLPLMKDIYGSHWTEILGSLTSFWSSEPKTTGESASAAFEDDLALIHASLKLYAVLRTLKKEDEANDDLVDAWKEAEPAASSGLVNLLKQWESVEDYYHQPLKITTELLARQISPISMSNLGIVEELFPLLMTESGSVQQAAFDILHKQIPAVQEQISLDAALEKAAARLPDELLSLILEAPTMDSLAEESFQRTMPLKLRGYLFSWLLIFDHFSNSSYKVKKDYIENLKEEGYVANLLDFLFDFLGHGKGKPVDVSKFDVTAYDFDGSETPEKETQYLLTHLYFLCLKHLPSLAKAWWIDCKSRQKVIAVESWTEKFISPHIITDALTTVNEWAQAQGASDADEALTVKVNQRAKEVTAGYEVDEQFMTIVIRLPPTYPLKQASVEGINRVAVGEQKWQAWLRNTQGVITFSNGDLVDGLTSWRKNVVGALKGQSECAICYSIVSADKLLPSKRCSTCKNLFHSSCLFKWFKTSNGSSCPLCRNAFNYG